MALDKELLDILACPNCRGDVEYREQEELVVCIGRCGYRYPVRDDFPVLLVDEAIKPDR
ncbi:MAG: Trm112 family protein [Actinomycetota bacterium]